MAVSKIQCLAVISASNAPIYLRSFDSKDHRQAELRYHFIAHGALDVIEERTSRASEQYLGLLLTTEDVAVYGFQTSTRLKFIVMITISDTLIKDLDMITIFRAMHTSYLSHMSNPFHSISGPLLPSQARTPPPLSSEAHLPPGRKQIRSALFERRMEKIAGWNPPPRGTSETTAPPTPAKEPPPAPAGKE